MNARIQSSSTAPAGVNSIRRVRVAPDAAQASLSSSGAVDILCSCDQPYVLPWQYLVQQQVIAPNWHRSDAALEEEREQEEAELPLSRSHTLPCSPGEYTVPPPLPSVASPVRDLAWSPHKKGSEGALYVTACGRQPLQLFQLSPEEGRDDGERRRMAPKQRSTFSSQTEMGVEADPYAVLWTTKGTSTSQVISGYGGLEERVVARWFDADAAQLVWSYRSLRKAAGPVSELHQHSAACDITSSLVFAGFFNSLTIDVIDGLRQTPAMKLQAPACGPRGNTGGVVSLSSDSSQPFILYVGGREWIHAWDVRMPLVPLVLKSKRKDEGEAFRFHRPIGSTQRCEMELFAGEKETWLCSASSRGGIECFSATLSDPQPGSHLCASPEAVSLFQEVGPSFGMARLLAGPCGPPLVAFSTGNAYPTVWGGKIHSRGGDTQANEQGKAQRGERNVKEAVEGSDARPVRRRALSPMSDEESEIVNPHVPTTPRLFIAALGSSSS